nr:MAG TPA: hypothetical protein [Caudoviricetes sp.]
MSTRRVFDRWSCILVIRSMSHLLRSASSIRISHISSSRWVVTV